jgi:hypothetical protein
VSNEIALHLIVAVLIATLVGETVCTLFLKWLVYISNAEIRDEHPHSVPPQVVGNFERLMAMVLVATSVDGTATILVGWTAAKLAANWQTMVQRELSGEKSRIFRARVFISLMTGTISLAIGVIAGLVLRNDFANFYSPIIGSLVTTKF